MEIFFPLTLIGICACIVKIPADPDASLESSTILIRHWIHASPVISPGVLILSGFLGELEILRISLMILEVLISYIVADI